MCLCECPWECVCECACVQETRYSHTLTPNHISHCGFFFPEVPSPGILFQVQLWSVQQSNPFPAVSFDEPVLYKKPRIRNFNHSDLSPALQLPVQFMVLQCVKFSSTPTNPVEPCFLVKDLTWISCPVNPHWPSLKPHSFLPISHLPATPKCMQVPSSPCTSPPTILAHGLLPMGLRVYWGEWCGQTFWLYISQDTQRPTPQVRHLPEAMNHDQNCRRTHLTLHRESPPAPQCHTPGTATARVRNKSTGGALVLWQEHTSQCLPPCPPSLSSPTGVGTSVRRSVSMYWTSWCKPFLKEREGPLKSYFPKIYLMTQLWFHKEKL